MINVRCPHCNNPMEILEESSLSAITCETCKSNFSLTGHDPTVTYESVEHRDIAQFRLLETVGNGAFGTVWKAKDTELDRTVAIKIPRKGQLDARESEQFLREARAVAQLQHPNIVSVHEIGRDDDTIYIVSDFVDGLTLADVLTARRFSARESAKLCAIIADALHHAHEAGVIHRDLKPGNIMLNAEFEPFVMDFGLAKREAADITMTVDGRVLGTPAYMSPEQARGESHHLDRRSDLYSLGVILFELLTAERPFRGNLRMLLHQVIHEEPPSPRKLNSNVDRDLETICLKCLQKQPSRRYSTAREVCEELERWRRREPIQARPITGAERCWRWCRRNPAVAALLTLVATLLVVGSVLATVAAVRFHALAEHAREEANRATVARRMESRARSDEARSRQMLELTLADTYTSFGLLAGDTADSAQAALWFANAAIQADDDPRRQRFNQIRFENWGRRLSIPIRVFQHGGKSVDQLQLHAGGEFLLTRTADGGCFVWNVPQETRVQIDDTGRMIDRALWSPNGSRLAVAWRGADEVGIFEFPSLEPNSTIPFVGPVSTIVFNDDGRLLALAGSTVRVWDCEARAFVTNPLSHPDAVAHMVFTNQGHRIATACQDELVRVFAVGLDATTSEPLFDPVPNAKREGFRNPIPPVFVDADQGLLTASTEDEVVCWNAESGDEQFRIPIEGRVFRVVPAPGSDRFLTCGFELAELWDAKTGEPVGEPMPHSNFVYAASFTADGSILVTASADRRARLWRIPQCEPLHADVPHQEEVSLVEFAGDGRFFATAQRDGVVRLWTLPAAGEPGRHVTLQTEQSFLKVTGDGRYMIPSGWDRERGLRSVQVYDVATGLTLGGEITFDGFFNAAAFSPDGAHVAILSSSAEATETVPSAEQLREHTGMVSCYSWRDSRRLFSPIATPTEPIGTSYSPDGDVVAVLCAAGEVLLIDADSGTLLSDWDLGAAVRPGFVVNERVRFSTDGRSLLTWGMDGTVRVHDPATGELKYELNHPGSFLTYDIDISSDGRWLATCATSGEMTTAIWNLETGQLVESIDHPDWVFHARFGPGTQGDPFLLTACRDGMARLWRWREKELVCPAFVHEDSVFDAVFLPQGDFIMTSSRDGVVRIWESLTGKPITPRLVFPGRCYQVLITGDGAHAIVTGSKNTLQLFELDGLVTAGLNGSEAPTLRLLCELISGQTIHEGGGVVNVTSREWIVSWQAFRTHQPEYLQGLYSDSIE